MTYNGHTIKRQHGRYYVYRTDGRFVDSFDTFDAACRRVAS